MDICHLRNAKLEPKLQKYIGRVVLRGDVVKDNSGAYAVFTEQGSSASQMTAAKVMDVIARLPDCDGQASDAVSAYTQVKTADAPRLLGLQCVYHDPAAQNRGTKFKTQWYRLKETCTDTQRQDCNGNDNFKRFW